MDRNDQKSIRNQIALLQQRKKNYVQEAGRT